MKKPIILIGGASGCGKSTLANDLLCQVKLNHRLGSGFVREIVRSQTDRQRDPLLYTFTFESDDPIGNMEAQADRLHAAILACIDRARREGTSLVIEGTHLIPKLYHNAPVDLFLVLAAPASDEHRRRLTGPTHVRREISERDWQSVQTIDTYYRAESAKFGVATLVYDDNLDKITSLVA